MDSQKLAALAIVMIAMAGYGLTIVASGALQAWWGIESSGSMIETVDLGCYWNNYCTNTATAIDWGSLSPGDSISRVIYVQNEGTAAVTLSMVTENWDPTSAANYLSLQWNREGEVLEAGEVLSATMTLSVSPNIEGVETFNFKIVLKGTS